MAGLNPFLAVGIHCTLFVTGLIGSMFILVVQFKDCLKTRELNPGDLIISCIVICNMSLQGTVLYNEICFFMFAEVFSKIVPTMAALMVSLAFSSLWCSTCLCFYYCVKIVNVGRTFLYRVQVRLPAVVPCLLGLSMAMSWMIGLPAYWDLFDTAQPNANITRNGTHMTYFTLNSRCNCLFEIYIFFSTVAFIIIFITAGAIIASLCRHMYQLKKINDGLGNGNVTSHISAARTVTFLLILYLAFYGALNAIFSETLEIGTVMFSLCFVAFSTFPTVNYVILITGNRKLSNTMKQLLGMKSSAEHTEPNISGV